MLGGQGSVLQKVEFQSSKSPKHINKWMVSVSEYRIEEDYVHLLGPDHEQKCSRKFILSFMMSHIPALTFDHCNEGVLKKTEFNLSERLNAQDVGFKNLPDIVISEEKARKVFFEFHRECWKINDGMLIQELLRVEEEVERNKVVAEMSRRAQQLRNHEEEVPLDIEEILITEDEMWENRDFINLS